MKILRLILLMALLVFMRCIHAAVPQAMQIGGHAVKIEDIMSTLEEARKNGQREFEYQAAEMKNGLERHEKELARYEEDLVALARNLESKRIGQLEHDAEANKIKRRMQACQRRIDTVNKDVESLHKQADQVTSIITNVVSQGVDVMMQTLREDATRKTQIAVAAASAAAGKEIENRGALARMQVLTSAENIRRMGTAAGVVGGSLIVTYFAAKFGLYYAQRFVGMPTLVRESSDDGLLGRIRNFFVSVDMKQEDIFQGIIFPNTEVANAVTRITLSTASATTTDIPQRGVIFYGPPGTGKTLMAKAIAQRSGDLAGKHIGYAIISGSDLSQFGTGAVQQLHMLLDRAEMMAERDGCFVVVIDEADSCLGDRRGGEDKDGEGRKVLNAFLQRTGAKTKVKMILITNDLLKLDPAVRDRASEEVLVSLHDMPGRVEVLKYYLKKYYGPENKNNFTVAPEVNDVYLQGLAGRLEGFSGRRLEDVVGLVQDQLAISQQRVITPAVIDAAAQEKVRQRAKAESYDFGMVDKPLYQKHSMTESAAVAA